MIIILYIENDFNGDWGLGMGDWGLGIGDWAQSPIPKPQNPIPKPPTPFTSSFYFLYKIIL